MNLSLDAYSPAARELLGPGGAYELDEVAINGVPIPVFKNAPAHLRELYQGALKHSTDTFFVYENERYTFADAWREVKRVMSALQQHNVKPGTRVGISMRNYPEWVFAYMGITSLGAVAVAMNAWWTGEEMIFAVEDSGLQTLFVDRERLEHLAPYLDTYSLQVVAVRTQNVAGNGVQSWADFLDSSNGTSPIPDTILEPTPNSMPDIDPDAPAMMLYTSGSTARPKGVVSSHRAIIHSVLGWEASAALARADAGRRQRPPARQPCMIITVPLFHVTGLNGQLLPSLRNGRKVVAMYKWEVDKALALIEREQVTHFSGVPTMAYELVNSPNYDKYDLSSLRSIGGGGAAMTPKHSKSIEQRSGNQTRASAAYAMTETNGLGASNAGASLQAKPASCGRPLRPLVSIRIIDEAGNPVPPGATGEICIKGPMNFTEYWNRPEETATTLIDGWVHTGDLGSIDDDGDLFITGRAKEMIIRGGENIACAEVESVIYEHPNVAECAVFGVPDERLGEVVAAAVVAKAGAILTAGDIQSHVSEHLARFKVPAHVVLFDKQLPRIASGKIHKRGVRDAFQKHMSHNLVPQS
ncbi:MAG: class I adenylate-forming enzyme family protein [Pseudomonadota bacterium]